MYTNLMSILMDMTVSCRMMTLALYHQSNQHYQARYSLSKYTFVVSHTSSGNIHSHYMMIDLQHSYHTCIEIYFWEVNFSQVCSSCGFWVMNHVSSQNKLHYITLTPGLSPGGQGEGVCHLKIRRKIKEEWNIHSLSQSLTLTVTLSPNH